MAIVRHPDGPTTAMSVSWSPSKSPATIFFPEVAAQRGSCPRVVRGRETRRFDWRRPRGCSPTRCAGECKVRVAVLVEITGDADRSRGAGKGWEGRYRLVLEAERPVPIGERERDRGPACPTQESDVAIPIPVEKSPRQSVMPHWPRSNPGNVAIGSFLKVKVPSRLESAIGMVVQVDFPVRARSVSPSPSKSAATTFRA
jgi:hypothetical protein